MITACFTISGNGCTPSTFIVLDDRRVFVHNRELGFFLHTLNSYDREFSQHIAYMVLDGFTIKPATEKQIAKYAAIIERNGIK